MAGDEQFVDVDVEADAERVEVAVGVELAADAAELDLAVQDVEEILAKMKPLVSRVTSYFDSSYWWRAAGDAVAAE